VSTLFKRLINRFNLLGMSTKIFLSFLMITIIPMSLVVGGLYSNLRAANAQRVAYSADHAFAQAQSVLDAKGSYAKEMIELLFMNEILQRFVNNPTAAYARNYGLQLLDFSKLIKQANSIVGRGEIVRFKLYIPPDRIHAGERVTCFSIEDIAQEPWYAALKRRPDQPIWLAPEAGPQRNKPADHVLPVVRLVKDINDLSRGSGVIRLDLDRGEIAALLEKTKVTSGTAVTLHNGLGDLVYSTSAAFEALPPASPAPVGQPAEWTTYRANGRQYMVRGSVIDATGWVLGMYIPRQDFYLHGAIRLEWVILPLAILLVTYLSAFIISRLSTLRLKALVSHIHRAGRGDFTPMLLPESKDEIGLIEQNFNQLLERVEQLMDRQFDLGQQIKAAELRFLQSQINPHFLYNTLDLIAWYVHMGSLDEVLGVVRDLSVFYKLSLSRGEDEIALQDELQHVRMYVSIQNRRFSNGISLDIRAQEDLLDCLILKATLQPIVENAIFHGIMEKESKAGTVRIEVREEGADIRIVVSDDGSGMSRQKLAQISLQQAVEAGSYGIHNIQERFAAMYGPPYGLTFESQEGRGTRVSLLLKKKRPAVTDRKIVL